MNKYYPRCYCQAGAESNDALRPVSLGLAFGPATGRAEQLGLCGVRTASQNPPAAPDVRSVSPQVPTGTPMFFAVGGVS